MADLLTSFLTAVGGVGVITIGVAKYVGEILAKKIWHLNEYKLKKEIEIIRNELEIEKLKIERKINVNQETLDEIWNSLVDLDQIGDELWDNPTKGNLFKFASQLERTQKIIRRKVIYLNDKEGNLKSIIDAFKEYQDKKGEFIKINDAFENRKEDIVKEITESNFSLRERYKEAIEAIEDEIRNRLWK